MSAKTLLAATSLVFIANVSIIEGSYPIKSHSVESVLSIKESVKHATLMPEEAKDVADAFEEALQEEQPGLQDTSKHKSLLRTGAEPSKVDPARLASKADLQAALAHDGPQSQFEKEVTDLMSGLASGGYVATPFGSGPDSPVARIKKLIEDMKPEITNAHAAQQQVLKNLSQAVEVVNKTKGDDWITAMAKKSAYTDLSPGHLICRQNESTLYDENIECHERWRNQKEEKALKCKEFKMVSESFGDYVMGQDIMKKGQGEHVDTYINRVSDSICGRPIGAYGYMHDFNTSKVACEQATATFATTTTECAVKDSTWHDRREKCDTLQDAMDTAACDWNVALKEVCETYEANYGTEKGAYDAQEKIAKQEEKDRQGEWKGLQRMLCIIGAFEDGKVEMSEIEACRNETYSVSHLVIDYPSPPEYDTACTYTQLFPTTADYKKAEFEPLPVNAKGKLDENECPALAEVSTTPLDGSPDTCKCQRITMTGPWTPGALVKCTNCTSVSNSKQANSCPAGTKLFAPRSVADWKTFLDSAAPLADPNFIVDITHPENLNGQCDGCATSPMRTSEKFDSWVTTDKAPWWLRSTAAPNNQPSGDYFGNCYLNILTAVKTDDGNGGSDVAVTFDDNNCAYNSKSYYCQTVNMDLSPGNPDITPSSCTCKKVELDGTYSASNTLVKCQGCLDVYKSTQKNSCPKGMKIFSPRTRADWVTFLKSAVPLRSPNWIIDITRPQDGCENCNKDAMKSTNTNQAANGWHTTDNSPWWLRDTTYQQPDGDYVANCYMDLWHTPPNENAITFDDGECGYHSRSYYCQPTKTTTTTTPLPAMNLSHAREELSMHIAKAASAKQLLYLEAGRLKYLADYMSTRVEVIKEKTDLAVNFGITEMMTFSTNWAAEIQKQVADAKKTAFGVTEAIDKANLAVFAKGAQYKDDVKEIQGKTNDMRLEIEKADLGFQTLMSFQDLISPRVNISKTDISTYTRVLDHFSDANATVKELPANCVGMDTGKPIAGKDYHECAAACDRLEETCMGFTFFPSKLCFLHRNIRSVTYYTSCQEELLQDQSKLQNNFLRLSCSVKTSKFNEKYANGAGLTKEGKDNLCPVYQDEGVTFKQPIELKAAAFSEGTYKIEMPGTYVIKEDIVFNPVTPLSSGVSGGDVTFPDPTSEKYPQLGGYFLGFFAAIAVQADDVTIDCEGKTIGMSAEFHKRQRFFAVIELGSQPFIAGVGPPQFANGLLTTTSVKSPNRVVIKNCKLGLSSHHGIHGNNANDVTILDTEISEFEVAGIHFNGVSNVNISGVKIGPNLQMTFGAQLSQATLIDHTMNTLLPMNPDLNAYRYNAKVTLRGEERTVNEVLMKLHNDLRLFYKNVGDAKTIDYMYGQNAGKNAKNLGLPDGSAVYGIIIHKTGPAAGDFASCRLEDAEKGGLQVENIHISDVQINDLALDVHQMTRLLVQGNQVMGPAGDVFDFETVTDDQDRYVGNPLSDAELAIGAFKAYAVEQGTATDQVTYFFGGTHVPQSVLNWAADNSKSWEFQPKTSSYDYDDSFSCFGDAMSHANKGAIGLFLNHIDSGTFSKITVSGIRNEGKIDADPSKCVQTPYAGLDARGVLTVNSPKLSQDALKAAVTVSGVNSTYNGTVADFDVMTS